MQLQCEWYNKIVYDIVEVDPFLHPGAEKVLFSTFIRDDAIETAYRLNKYFRQYTDDCPFYYAKIRDVIRYRSILEDVKLPEMKHILFRFTDDLEIKPMYLALSKMQAQLDKINTYESQIMFNMTDEEYDSFETIGYVKVDVTEVLKANKDSDHKTDPLFLLKSKANVMVSDISGMIKSCFGDSLQGIVNSIDFTDLDDKFKPIIKDIDDFHKVIYVADLYNFAHH